jgi:aldose 1-epimerase
MHINYKKAVTMSPDILALGSARSNWRMQLIPSRGGAAIAMEARHNGRWHPITQPTSAEALRDDLRLRYSNYALVPYSNRIADGKVPAAAGHKAKHPLPGNWPGLAHPMHGLGWLLPWRVAQQNCRKAVLILDWRGGDAWPWPMQSEQRLRLLGRNVLQMDLRVTNTGTEPMPAGLGWHPYFKADAGVTMRMRARRMQSAGANGLPVGLTSPP